MSLKFLAVGRTVAGIRGDKSPYALRKENQLPTFEGAPRFAGKPEEKAPLQTDWLQPAEAKVEANHVTDPFQPETPPPAPLKPKQPKKPKRRWFSFFGLKWFRASKPRADLVQSELSLDKVRVMRNDLADSDLELVLKRKKKKAKPVFVATQQNNNLPREGWTELAAKLFEIGQK